jgi:hypothetical protein
MNQIRNKNKKVTPPKIKPQYLRLDERINAIDYLERAYGFIKQVDSDPLAWKWTIIALHGALYGFAICACAGSSPDLVAPIIKKGKNQGKRQLISFNKALEYCQNSNVMEMYVFSKTLVLTASQNESVEWLKNEFRDNFEHFSPKSWSIELHGITHIVIDILDIIRFLAIETRNIHLKRTQKKTIKSSIYQSKRILKKSRLHKETV